ncbi:MAG: O-antigen ligase family protein [Gammaproteobacteria bacterium]|nr:O-antigen ligase family protein [Gammaproteobacteria bacterium]
MDNYVRFLFALPLYLLIREINIKEVYFKLIINHASLVIGVSAIYFHIYHDSVRINGYTSTATIYGNISLLFACLSLLSIKPLKDSLFKYYPIISAILAFHAWSLTGTRSSLLIIPIFIIIFLFSKDLRENFLPKVNLKLVSIFLIVIAIIISQSNVYKRSIDSYETSYSYFFENGEFNWKHRNSLVPRLLIWKGTMNIIKENPLMGVGQDNFNQYLNSQIKDKKIDPIRNNQQNPTAGLNHAHNQYLDIFAKTGITGLFLLLFFLIMNLFFFLKRYLHNKNCFYAKSGLLTIITYSTYMLNHTIISHQQSSLFLSFFLIMLAGLSNHMKNAKL